MWLLQGELEGPMSRVPRPSALRAPLSEGRACTQRAQVLGDLGSILGCWEHGSYVQKKRGLGQRHQSPCLRHSTRRSEEAKKGVQGIFFREDKAPEIWKVRVT